MTAHPDHRDAYTKMRGRVITAQNETRAVRRELADLRARIQTLIDNTDHQIFWGNDNPNAGTYVDVVPVHDLQAALNQNPGHTRRELDR